MIGFLPWQTRHTALLCLFAMKIMRDGGSCQEHRGILFCIQPLRPLGCRWPPHWLLLEAAECNIERESKKFFIPKNVNSIVAKIYAINSLMKYWQEDLRYPQFCISVAISEIMSDWSDEQFGLRCIKE